jgi:hypothetical protein
MVRVVAGSIYATTLRILTGARVPFVVGGAFALKYYAGLTRGTKDLDIFLRERDVRHALRALERAHFTTSRTFPHWLAKAFLGEHFVDFIFNSANGLCPVDDNWFKTAPRIRLFDVDTRLCPIEEVIWTKSFVMERDRFDGADIAHLLVARGHEIDWKRLLSRYGKNWRILYGHLVFFSFIFPHERHMVPAWMMNELAERMRKERFDEDVPVCQGTLLSREQYLVDVKERGYADARMAPWGRIPAEHIRLWTHAIGNEK